MKKEIKLYNNSKNTYYLLINEVIINELKLNNKKELCINLILDKNYKKHIILTNKPIKSRFNIYYYFQKITKNNKRSKTYRIVLNIVITNLLNVNFN